MTTIHLISHTHWDREWYLTFQQFRCKLLHMMDILLDILDKNQDYLYFLLDGQAIILEDYLEICPDRENELIRHISEGRILIGPWYISPDEFLITGEAHIRNLLEGDRICSTYGGKMRIGYLPDTFGHIGQMPQILQGFGIKEACAWRGIDDQVCELIWKSPDDSSVLLSFLRESYSNAANLSPNDPENFIKEIQELSIPLAENSLTDQILLMNGTDHMEPSSDLSTALEFYRAAHLQDPLFHSTLPKYFDRVYTEIRKAEIKLPEIVGELRSSKRVPLLPNVLSTRMHIKQRNRKCETELLKWVEPLNALINWFEDPSPSSTHSVDATHYQNVQSSKSLINYAWKLLMNCHPHDSICGTTIDQVAKEMEVRFDQVDQLNNAMIDQGFQKLCSQINTISMNMLNSQEIQADIISSIIVFNPNGIDSGSKIDILANFDKQYKSLNIIDENGVQLPCERLGMGGQELISMTLDKKAMKQSLRMIHEGNVAGMVIRNFEISQLEGKVIIRVTLSDHGLIDLQRWKEGVGELEEQLTDPSINEFIVHAYADPETKLSFIAREVPSHGYRCYWIQGVREDINSKYEPRKLSSLASKLLPLISLVRKLPFVSLVSLGKNEKSFPSKKIIENEYFIVELQVPDSSISITDQRTNKKYEGQNNFIDTGDCGDVYNFCPPEFDSKVRARLKNYQVVESAIDKKMVVQYEMRVPANISQDRKSRSKDIVSNTIICTITLQPGVPRVDFHTEVDNKASDHRLRVHFQAPFHCDHSFHDGQFEVVKRSIGLPKYDETWVEPPRQEVPQGDFTLIHSGDLSVTIANRGLPEIEVTQSNDTSTEIALTLIRSIGWLSRDDLATRKGHAGPMGITTPEAQMIGKYLFDYSFIPGGKDLSESIHQAYTFNAPLRSATTTIHSGKLPPNLSFIKSDNQDFILTAIKLSEKEDNLIVRGFNRLPALIEVNLTLWRSFKHAYLVSLDENIIQEILISSEGLLHLYVDHNKVITLKFSD
jgi:mannosylglycerate hydrolase